ncbi:glycosyltransferase [Sphingomonas sp. SUN019]|uniref:glycosyltransferase n=1 Tax=Sphingomonas sp. SUN019 TaxID=2937788 RepID=UPI0021645400|nr:glycosyltransferase [Sphingomonas sp. SUN019]UVO50926.1 glycosyltransferase [Sphingomonas sp. SUN019]
MVALVNNAGVIDVGGVEARVIPEAKTSWLRRIYVEYVALNRISKQIRPDIWWSLHDMSPRVKAGSQFVYCHNPAPFHRFSWAELSMEPKLIPFSALYSLFYRINIRSNRAVIVQQDWIRREFMHRYGVRNVVVAHPVESQPGAALSAAGPVSTFVYPALSRVFKNFDLIGDAVRLLDGEPDWRGRVVLTIDPEETRLTRDLFRRYGDLRGLHFVGRQDRDAMTKLYEEMDCLLFPSRLETWGLPITEAKSLGKPIIAADLPYAHETVGTYDHVRFVDPADPRALADIMLAAHRSGWTSQPVRADPIAAPFAGNWPQLVETIVALHERGVSADGTPHGRGPF